MPRSQDNPDAVPDGESGQQPAGLPPLVAVVLLGLAGTTSGQGLNGTDSVVDVELGNWAAGTLEVTWHSPTGDALELVGAEAEGWTLTLDREHAFGIDAGTSASLMLVDTSDPRRDQEVADLSLFARDLAASMVAPSNGVALAGFDDAIELLSAFETDAATLELAFDELTAGGATTELWRSTLDAIGEVAQETADRRFVIVFSDGKAEDVAYSIDDVVRAAADGGVVIHAVGTSRTASESVNLQNIRRVAEETGGLFFALPAEDDSAARETALRRLRQAMVGGGTWSFTASAADGTPQSDVTLTYLLRGEEVEAILPVAGAAAATADGELPLTIIIPAGVAVALVLLVLLLRRRRQTEVYGILRVLGSGDHEVFAIDKPSIKLGRNDENDLSFDNTSVSDFHAQIHRRRDGVFVITDLDSTNGLTVNGENVSSGPLDWQDIIELGEVRVQLEPRP